MNALQSNDPGRLMTVIYIYGITLAIYYFLSFKLFLTCKTHLPLSHGSLVALGSSTDKLKKCLFKIPVHYIKWITMAIVINYNSSHTIDSLGGTGEI